MRRQLMRMMPAAVVVVTLAASGTGVVTGRGAPPANAAPPAKDRVSVTALLAAIDSLTANSSWPGFDPRSIPVAIGTDDTTYLYRHPVPPLSFKETKGSPDLWTAPGLYDSIRANSSAMIEGVRTATLLPASTKATGTRDLAGTAIHEMFHVYQHERHGDWIPNELDRFLYPAADTTLIATRLLETSALRRALGAKTDGESAGWFAEALRLRSGRHAAMPAPAAKYENQLELQEGLAEYVRLRAMNAKPGMDLIPAGDFAPDAARDRAYATGAAMAFLLDRVEPGWVARFDSSRVRSLAAFADSTLRGHSPAAVSFTAADEKTARDTAARAVGTTVAARTAERESFVSRPGWRLTIVAESGNAIWVNKFDPMNIAQVGARELLHRRWVKVSNSTFSLEARDCEVLTEAAGDHPLMNGAQIVRLTGLSAKPELVKGETGTLIKGDCYQASIPGESFWMEQTGEELKIYLKAAPPKVHGSWRKG